MIHPGSGEHAASVILGLAAEGARVAEIADRLLISLQPGPVRDYLSAVIAKTSARSRVDAIRIVAGMGAPVTITRPAACASASKRMTRANFED
jgi:DNA-binding CsgD family transcriptional regulator